MDEYFEVIKALPDLLAKELAQLEPSLAAGVQEIRLRAGVPVLLTVKGRLMPCGHCLPQGRCTAGLDAEMLQTCFLTLCHHSAYAYEEELRCGFLTIAGGSRVGVAGEWGVEGFLGVTALNIRVARWLTCEIPPILQQLLAEHRDGVLVAGPPGSGKTTLLRSMLPHLSREGAVVCVVDERQELLAGAQGDELYRRGVSCDAFVRCPRAQAVQMALRCMNPQVIVCDELGGAADAAALEQAVASGVCIVASVHCDTPENLAKKPQLSVLLRTGAFGTAVFLEGRERAGEISRVVTLK